jgi:ribonucleoside-triphosphate reductase
VETFPNRHDSLKDYLKTLRYAWFYAKTVTLGATHWPQTNRVLLRNRRVGCSMSGIAQYLATHNIEAFRQLCTSGYDMIQEYDKEFSEMYCIPKSIKTTSIKPSGTVSLLAGATPGMHYPKSQYYIRRMRIATNSDLTDTLKKEGYHVEPLILSRQKRDGAGLDVDTLVYDEQGRAVMEDYPSPDTSVVSFAVCSGKNVRTEESVGMWEQLNLAAFLQKYWADNQVSCTVSFDPVTEGPQMAHALNYFQYQLKGISFLPRHNYSAMYKQTPYEEIDEKTYNEMIAQTKVNRSNKVRNTGTDETSTKKKRRGVDPMPELYCDGDKCVL